MRRWWSLIADSWCFGWRWMMRRQCLWWYNHWIGERWWWRHFDFWRLNFHESTATNTKNIKMEILSKCELRKCKVRLNCGTRNAFDFTICHCSAPSLLCGQKYRANWYAKWPSLKHGMSKCEWSVTQWVNAHIRVWIDVGVCLRLCDNTSIEINEVQRLFLQFYCCRTLNLSLDWVIEFIHSNKHAQQVDWLMEQQRALFLLSLPLF